MAQVFLGLGSNLGDRLGHLESALGKIRDKVGPGLFRVSSICETPPLCAPGDSGEGHRPYLNLVVELDLAGEVGEWFAFFQEIERSQGRVRDGSRWAPRTLDIDILHWEGKNGSVSGLQLPHPGIFERSFVLDPLAELAPDLILPGKSEPVLYYARRHPQHQPRWMGILNITPDSFSDGGQFSNLDSLTSVLNEWEANAIAYLDVGAHSTRPGAQLLSVAEEWSRLEPVLKLLKSRYVNRQWHPKVSVDTFHAEIALRSLSLGASVINDVSALSDPRMFEVIAASQAEIVLMHNLGVPADPTRVIPENVDVVEEILNWSRQKLDFLVGAGIALNRIVIDPGIGFGKTGSQSRQIIQQASRFQSLGCAILFGHSRKSLFKTLNPLAAMDRDPETLGGSLSLITQGVDILRVHNPLLHQRTCLAWRYCT